MISPVGRISLALLLVAAVACGPEAVAAEAPRPNVIILFADDLGYGDVGCFGDGPFETPNLDRMARGGVRLTNFYVPMPYSAPSRATILTGRYPFRHGLVHNPCPDARPENDLLGLDLEEITLADTLKQAGYSPTVGRENGACVYLANWPPGLAGNVDFLSRAG